MGQCYGRRPVATLVERVETADRKVVRMIWTAPARPFFGTPAADAALLGEAPPDALAGSESKAFDPLAWFTCG